MTESVHDVRLPTWIIIAASKRDDLTERCVNSICLHTPLRNIRLHMVLAGSVNLSQETRQACEIIDEAPTDPFNFAQAMNLAMRQHPDCDVILLNNDCEVTPGWLEKLRDTVSQYLALIGVRTDHKCSGNPDHWLIGAPKDRRIKVTGGPINMFCAYLPAKLRRVAGLLDEGYPGYGGEDCDYAIRCRRHLFQCLISPAYVKHVGSASFAADKTPLIRLSNAELHRRWGVEIANKPYESKVTDPLVSVVVAAYNEEKFLDEALRSICDQTFGSLEILVIDDGSTDGTGRIAQRWHEQDQRVIVHRIDHCGAAAAKNHGATLAKGEFLAFQDADDVSEKTRIAKQLAMFREEPWLDVTYTNLLETRDMCAFEGFRTQAFDKAKLLRQQFYVAGATFLMRRCAWDVVGPNNPVFHLAHDYEWILRANAKGVQIGYLSDPVYFYRRHGGNLTGTADGKAQHNEIAEMYKGVAGGMKVFFCVAPSWTSPIRWLYTPIAYFLKIAEVVEARGGKAAFILPDKSCVDAKREVYLSEGWKDALAEADALFVWNGGLSEELEIVEACKGQGTPIIYAELGWLPQRHNLYFDTEGVGPNMSLTRWRYEPLEKDQQLWLVQRLAAYHRLMNGGVAYPEVKRGGFTFCPLQVEEDSNIVRFAPQFSDMQNLINLVLASVPKPIVFKTHPKAKRRAKDYTVPAGCDIADDLNLHEMLRTCDCVVTINSTVGVEALTYFKHVLTLGECFFGGRNITIVCKDGKDLAAKWGWASRSPVKRPIVEAFLYALFQKQWSKDDLDDPYKVSAMLETYCVTE